MDRLRTPAEQLKELSTAYWESQVLFTAVKLNLFKEMGDRVFSSRELGERIGAVPDALERLLAALFALGLLNQSEKGYRIREAYRPYLSQEGNRDMSGAIAHMDHLQATWQRLGESVKSGGPVDFGAELTASEQQQKTEKFMAAMESFSRDTARELVDAVPVQGDEEIIDLGCGPGTYFRGFLRTHPGMKATAVDTEDVIPITKRHVKKDGLQDRTTLISGDLRDVSYPKGHYDLALFSNLIHIYSPEDVSRMCALAYTLLRPGARILINEFFTDRTGTRPHWGALFSLNMLLNTQGGRNYRLQDGESFLNQAGFEEIHSHPLCMHSTLLVARKPWDHDLHPDTA